jgi:hypothetical protein
MKRRRMCSRVLPPSTHTISPSPVHLRQTALITTAATIKSNNMISALYILDLKGKIIISRDYRGDISINYVERFVTKILEEEESSLKPIFEEDGVSYIYIKHNNLYGNWDAQSTLKARRETHCVFHFDFVFLLFQTNKKFFDQFKTIKQFFIEYSSFV